MHVVFILCTLRVKLLGLEQGTVTTATRRERMDSCKLQRHTSSPFASELQTGAISPLHLLFFSASTSAPPPFFGFSYSITQPFLLPSKDRGSVNNSCVSSLRQKCDTCAHMH